MKTNNELLNQINTERILKKASTLGATYVDIRFQNYQEEIIRIEDEKLDDYNASNRVGIGIRVTVNNAVGFASTSDLSKNSIDDTLKDAIKAAKSFKSKKGIFANTRKVHKHVYRKTKIDSFDISPEEKVSLLLEVNKAAKISDEIKNQSTLMGCSLDYKFFTSSEGFEYITSIPLIGIHHISVASLNGKLERMQYGKGDCMGYEYIRSKDWNEFTKNMSKLAIQAVKAEAPPSGTYTTIADPDLVGLIVHEAFGHASEADLVFTGSSTLKDRLGEQLADEQVTIIDQGDVEGGYYVPFDDEGVIKEKTVVLDKGVLKGYLHDRNSANELNVKTTGNARAQDFENQPQVRMTNTFIDQGKYSLEEMMEDVKLGVYAKRIGAGGGQVDTASGTFTFRCGESWMIRNGKLAEPVRGVVLSGLILDTLKTVDAVGNDLSIHNRFFGACGKGGQRASVGSGGPHIRIQEITIGGK